LPWCGKRHRHHARQRRPVYNKARHCPVWRELFEDQHYGAGVTVYIAAEITEADARRQLAERERRTIRYELEGDLISRRERGLPPPSWLAPYTAGRSA
jgi:hypothetical protein